MSFFIVGRKFFGHQRNFLVLHGDAQGGLEDFTFDPRSATHFDSREEAEAAVSALMLRPDRVDGQGYEVIERRPKPPAPHQEQPTPKGQGPEVLPALLAHARFEQDPRTAAGRKAALLRGEFERRIAVGVSRYGEPLRANNGRDPIRDAREECLDLALYVTQIFVEGRVSRRFWERLVDTVFDLLDDLNAEALEAHRRETRWAVEHAEMGLGDYRAALEDLRAREDATSWQWAHAWRAVAHAEGELARAKDELAGFFDSGDYNKKQEETP